MRVWCVRPFDFIFIRAYTAVCVRPTSHASPLTGIRPRLYHTTSGRVAMRLFYASNRLPPPPIFNFCDPHVWHHLMPNASTNESIFFVRTNASITRRIRTGRIHPPVDRTVLSRSSSLDSSSCHEINRVDNSKSARLMFLRWITVNVYPIIIRYIYGLSLIFQKNFILQFFFFFLRLVRVKTTDIKPIFVACYR